MHGKLLILFETAEVRNQNIIQYFLQVFNKYHLSLYNRVAVTFLCRLLPGTTIGEGVYGDEFDNFECVTTQPGCSQVCFNLFAPMSHPRFWSMQVRQTKMLNTAANIIFLDSFTMLSINDFRHDCYSV